jgi:DNA-binding CsgD family transcriptional regulator
VELNAGDKTSTTCPPALNKSVKQALLNEIKHFDEKKARKEIEDSANGGAATNAYHNWLDQNGGHEPVEANPDVLAENDGLKYIESKKDSLTASLLTDVRQSFSRKELQVWNLVMKHNISQRDAADLLHMSRNALQMHLKRATDKFTKFMEASR